MNRRDLLRTAAVAVVVGAGRLGAAESPRKTALGIVKYARQIRQASEKASNPDRDLFEPLAFLEHCRQLGAGGIQVPLGVRDGQYARDLRGRAAQYGMFIEAIVEPPRDRTDVERFAAAMRTAAEAGARAACTVLFPGRRYEEFDSAEQFRRCEEQAQRAVELAAPVAEKYRLPLAVENHKDQLVRERLELLKRISSRWVGMCVDVGNNIALLEDPIEVIEAFAPWAIAVHLKDHAVQESADGFLLADVPLGKGFLDLKKVVAILRKARPEIQFGLEVITRDPLRVPCLTEKYWATLAAVSGRDLARAMRLIRQHRAETLPTVRALPREQQVALEDATVKTSLAYARDELGI
ncbi:MAG: sugar phosphate isomerase/epimerase family protein [Pirellulales bacterium]